MLSKENIVRFMALGTENAPTCCTALKEACWKFIQDRGAALSQDAAFRKEMEGYPELGFLLYECVISTIGSGSTSQEGNNLPINLNRLPMINFCRLLIL